MNVSYVCYSGAAFHNLLTNITINLFKYVMFFFSGSAITRRSWMFLTLDLC